MSELQSVSRLAEYLSDADAVMLGAGAGLSTAAGYTYTGERFERYFADMADEYNFGDMYSGGFCEFDTPEARWAYWSRYIWINRYAPVPGTVYGDLKHLLDGRDSFVLTTNVDHCFQRAGFEKERLFYTQGDYGLWQCSRPCRPQTWDNRDIVKKMVESQGYTVAEDGTLVLPEGKPLMRVPGELVPRCPYCGRPVSMNLRADDTFVQDEGWERACERYSRFVRSHRDSRIVYLEIGVGGNTPGIVKYNFWNRTYENPNARYVCLNYEEMPVPQEIADRSLVLTGDAQAIIRSLLKEMNLA